MVESTDRERLARFEREARSSSALNQRNIVTIHDFTSQDGEACLVRIEGHWGQTRKMKYLNVFATMGEMLIKCCADS